MLFEIGKKYLCRNGEIVTIKDISSAFLITIPQPRYNEDIGTEIETTYYSDGIVSRAETSHWDIISEYIEQETIPSLSNKDIDRIRGNGGSTSYYDLPNGATELGHLIKHKKMEHGIGEAFCALYRLNDNGEYKRNLTKAKYYIEKELEWLEQKKG